MCWELAGFVGVDPRPLTLRVLWWMTEGKRMAAYDLNADLKAMMIVAGGGKPIAPAKLNPLRVAQERRKREREPVREPTEAESAAAWALLGRGLGIVTIPPPKPKEKE